MGLWLKDRAEAAKRIKGLTDSLGVRDVRVRVRSYPNPLVCVELMENDRTIAGFTLVEQANCCGVMVSTKTFVTPERAGQRIAQSMMPLKEAIALEFGYTVLAATVNMTGNPAEVHILKKCGWVLSYEFKNDRTKNQVGFFFKNLRG